MEPRRLKDLAQLPATERLDVIAEGLSLLAEQARTLRDDLVVLAEARRSRAYAVVNVTAEEEAAKALILLDLVRTGWREPQLVGRQLRRFYDHLVRLIYAEMCHMRPADFAEVRRLVEIYRPSHYLDGPSDVDFIFRNQTLAQREEALYVDYVRDEDGARWVSPATHDSLLFGHLAVPLDLVISLDRVGCTSREGLDVIATAWDGVVIEDSTHWQEARALNQQIARTLLDRGLNSPDADGNDVARVVDRWIFPITQLDLELVHVTTEELRADRARGLAAYDDY
jgi:hypothetical protein